LELTLLQQQQLKMEKQLKLEPWSSNHHILLH
jgi:hypothetical protein